MKKCFLLGTAIMFFFTGFSQNKQLDNKAKEASDTSTGNKIFTIVQIEAEFPGGKEGWGDFLRNNLRFDTPDKYKAPAGKYSVIVEFKVMPTGEIDSVRAINDPGFHTAEEAIRVVKKSPKWSPAVQNGKNVSYRARQQITFVVENESRKADKTKSK